MPGVNINAPARGSFLFLLPRVDLRTAKVPADGSAGCCASAELGTSALFVRRRARLACRSTARGPDRAKRNGRLAKMAKEQRFSLRALFARAVKDARFAPPGGAPLCCAHKEQQTGGTP
jgi:hypothetical protein